MYELFVGLRYLASRSRASLSIISVVSILGVFLGVTALVSVVSVTGGFQEEFRDKVLGVNSHLLVMTFAQDDFREYREVQARIERELDGVVVTAPFIFHEMMIASESNLSGILIKGVEPDLLEQVSDLPRYFVADNEDGKRALINAIRHERGRSDAPPNILMGYALAEKLKVEIGDTVRVVSPRRGIPGEARYGPRQMQPTDKAFRVAGLYRSGFYDYDNRLVITDFRAMQDFFNHPDVVSGVEIKVADIHDTTRMRNELEAMLNGNRPIERFRIIDWKDLNHNLFTSLQLQKITLTIIMTFIVIVASFNIVGTLIMLVLDKQKEIAIMKSMGATDGGIMRVFIFQGLFIGGLGTALGLLGGFGVCTLISYYDLGLDPQVYLIDRLPVKMVPLEFAIVGVCAIAISFLATLYPSWWAAQLEPVEGLRYE